MILSGATLAAVPHDLQGRTSDVPVSGVRSQSPRGMDDCRSLVELFLKRVQATPEALAYQYPASDGSYAELKWREVGERVRSLAAGLCALGLAREECCAIISGTRIEWVLADLAVLCAGGATTTVYPTSPASDCRYILEDSASAIAFVENLEQLAKLREHRAELGRLRKVVLFEGETENDGWVISLAELEALGRRHDRRDPGEFERVARLVGAEQLATLMYTSGTTGQPKGVRLSHDGWLYQSEVGANLKLMSSEDHQYLFLPLSHAMGKVLEMCAIRVGFPTTVDARVPQLMENLLRVRPTFMGAPPRLFEKLYAKIEMAVVEAGGAKRAIFQWACRVGSAVSRVVSQRKKPTGFLRLKYWLADKLVFKKLRARFGGRMRFMFSGSAALRREVAEFFHGAGLLVLEGYGLTESSAGAILNRMDDFAFGSVGKPLPGTELSLDDDGEILLRSRGVMQGYHKLPDDTRAALTPDGWLRTGDIGELDEDGFLRITDRKKDLFKTSTGLYVAPLKVEAAVKAACPYVAQIVVHGEGRKYVSALIALDNEAAAKLLSSAGSAAPDERHSQYETVADKIRTAIARVNSTLASHERIRKFALLPLEPSVENGMLTASMKLRRRAIESRYRDLLDEFYTRETPGGGTNATPEWIVAA